MKLTRIAVLAVATFAIHLGGLGVTIAQDTKQCIHGTVSVAVALAGKLKPAATLFVYVREIDRSHGAPTAVISIKEPRYPQAFKLCPSDQMLPDAVAKPLSGLYRVHARHSATGKAMVEEGFVGVAAGANGAGIRAGESAKVLIDRAVDKAK